MPPGSGLQSRARAPHSPARAGTGEVTITCYLIGDNCQRYSDITISSLPDVIRQSMGTYSVRGSSGWTIGTGSAATPFCERLCPVVTKDLGRLPARRPNSG